MDAVRRDRPPWGVIAVIVLAAAALALPFVVSNRFAIDVAMLMGINPDRVFAVAVGVSLALAGAAGSLLMPFYPAFPLVGQVFVLMAFVAVVLGTLGNVTGALLASLMMGVAESLGIQFVGADSGLIVVFAMLLLTLAFKPTGLGGGRMR